MLIKALRNGLGMIIVFANWLTLPKPVRRAPTEQERVNEQARALRLYQFRACPFCIKVRRHLHRLNVPVTLVEAGQGSEARAELEQQGGKRQVPCLRIETAVGVEWLYESSAIIEYLDRHFAPAETAA